MKSSLKIYVHLLSNIPPPKRISSVNNITTSSSFECVFSNANIVRTRIIIYLLSFLGEVFKGFADEYLRNALKKGIPPLFTNMRSLYSDKTKVNSHCFLTFLKIFNHLILYSREAPTSSCYVIVS